MSSWRPSFQPDHLYFVTTKAVDYVHVFRRNTAKRLLVDTLDCYRLRGRLRLYCFVIMPNHIHLIAQFSADDPLASVMRDLKQHSADRLIRHLKAEGARLVDESPRVGGGGAKIAFVHPTDLAGTLIELVERPYE